GLFEEHAQGVGLEAESRGDARRQAIAAGCTDHQDLLRPILAHAQLAGGFDLVTDVELAALRVGRGADETADLRMNDGQCLYLIRCLGMGQPPTMATTRLLEGETTPGSDPTHLKD